MAYNIEIRRAAKTGWHTPAEARRYYGRYARNGITVHWWNNPNSVGRTVQAHNNIVNYILGKARAGTGSVNYVVSNQKITLLVGPDNVAWASQGGNPTTISVEFSPHLNAEGYKKAGWLIDQLEKRYKRGLKLYRHSHWISTQCPGTLNLNRMRQKANKWKQGGYNPKPKPKPAPKPQPKPPAKAKLTWKKWDKPETHVTIRKAKLWRFDRTAWSQFGNGIKTFKKGEKINIYGEVLNHNLNAQYLLTEYSFTRKIPHGFNAVDLDVYVEPRKTPEPPKEQEDIPQPDNPLPPVEPTLEERVSLLENIIEAIKAALAKIGIKL